MFGPTSVNRSSCRGPATQRSPWSDRAPREHTTLERVRPKQAESHHRQGRVARKPAMPTQRYHRTPAARSYEEPRTARRLARTAYSRPGPSPSANAT
jgi:hypothetical protein